MNIHNVCCSKHSSLSVNRDIVPNYEWNLEVQLNYRLFTKISIIDVIKLSISGLFRNVPYFILKRV